MKEIFELSAKMIAILIGASILYLFVNFLFSVYQDYADYCESVKEDKEKEFYCEVDVDPETGQRTSTIINQNQIP